MFFYFYLNKIIIKSIINILQKIGANIINYKFLYNKYLKVLLT